jgi:SpoVK/Ycf46/Vps4 family AAA+-type ATPase
LQAGQEKKLERVIREHKAIQILRARGLSPRRKLLLTGKPGTGKTITASALASELGLPLFVVRLDGLITKFMGETSAKLRIVFEAIGITRGSIFLTSSTASARREVSVMTLVKSDVW